MRPSPLPDFLPGRPRAPWPAWAACACAALVLAVQFDDLMQLNEATQDLQAELSRRSLAAPARSASSATPAWTAAVRDAGAREARTADRLLRFDWRDVFEVPERAAASTVQWSRLQADAERGELQLDGVARDREAVVATVEALAGTPGWSSTALQRLERQGERLRFEARVTVGGMPEVPRR